MSLEYWWCSIFMPPTRAALQSAFGASLQAPGPNPLSNGYGSVFLI